MMGVLLGVRLVSGRTGSSFDGTAVKLASPPGGVSEREVHTTGWCLISNLADNSNTTCMKVWCVA